MQYTKVIIEAEQDGRKLYISRRQNLEKELLSGSVTTKREYAYEWMVANDASVGERERADAEQFRAHAEEYAPIGWQLVEVN